MKKIIFLSFLFPMLLACSNSHTSIVSSDSTDQYSPPSGDSVVTKASMPIIEDKLNHSGFSVTVAATADSKSKGTYNVIAEWGYNAAKGEFTMPAGGEHLKPVIREGSKPYSYVVGFYYGKDSAFYEYFLVVGGAKKIEMKYIKVYSFK